MVTYPPDSNVEANSFGSTSEMFTTHLENIMKCLEHRAGKEKLQNIKARTEQKQTVPE